MLEMESSLFAQGEIEYVTLFGGRGVEAAVPVAGGTNPNGVTTPVAAALVVALVEFAKNLISICGETSVSGAGDGRFVQGSLALISIGGPLLTAMGMSTLANAAGAVSVPPDGIGGNGRQIGMGGGTGASKALIWLTTGGGETRNRNDMGPACGK